MGLQLLRERQVLLVAWWGYSVEPLEFSKGWYENEVGQRIKIEQEQANPNWKNSLTKII